MNEANWIACADRLPDDKQNVLLWMRKGRLDVGIFRQGKWLADNQNGPWSGFDQWGNNRMPYGWSIDGHSYDGQDVTHWAPAPEGPSK